MGERHNRLGAATRVRAAIELGAFAVVGTLVLGAPSHAATPSTPPSTKSVLKAKAAVVDHVADGDTIQVQIGGREEDIRFIGIDTPEVYGTVECGGPGASRSMKRLLQPGDHVTLVRDRTQDNRDFYGRLLRYVQLGGRDLGRKQVRRGWARVYVFDHPSQRVHSYRHAQRKARRSGRGVWGQCGGFSS